MSCLNDARLRAVADGEGTHGDVEHVQTCPACRGRVNEARDEIREFTRGMASIAVPPLPRPRAGATTLREQPSVRVRRPAWIAAGAAAAAIVLALFVVFPSFDSGTRLNAAEILNRSLQTLAGTGVELLNYELSLQAPRLAPADTGTFRIEQLIDHENGRWRYSRFAADGSLSSAIVEDPTSNRRELFVRQDGRTYRFAFTLAPDDRVPIWDAQRRYAEALIRLVQASGAKAVTTASARGEPQYVVELPEAASTGGSPIFDVHRAKVVIDAADFHIVEFSAAGSALGDVVSIDYKLIERSVWGSLPANVTFELPGDPASVELSADATTDIARDVLTLLLRSVRQ